MTNAEFERFLELSIKNFGHEYIDYSEDWYRPFEFSAKFERKMEKLIKRQKKPYYVLICTAGRRIACIVAAIIIAGSAAMSVKAIREWVVDFVVEHFWNHDKISSVVDVDMSYPRTIEQEYTIDIPEGFVIDENTSYKTLYCIKKRYINREKFIEFKQMLVNRYEALVDNERYMMEYYTDEKGIVYTIYSWKTDGEYFIFLWGNYDYAFYIKVTSKNPYF